MDDLHSVRSRADCRVLLFKKTAGNVFSLCTQRLHGHSVRQLHFHKGEEKKHPFKKQRLMFKCVLFVSMAFVGQLKRKEVIVRNNK